MHFATVTDKGEPVIPQSIRDALHLSPGSQLLVSLEAGRVILEPRRGLRRELIVLDTNAQVRLRRLGRQQHPKSAPTGCTNRT
jgi:AbrB family looped-hinge helix DNA binding protein